MGLTQTEVFENTLYKAGKDLLRENVEIFNGFSNGAIVLSESSIIGDFSQNVNVVLGSENIVKSRNPYANNTLTSKTFNRVIDNTVKLGLGTHPIEWTYAYFNWVKQNPELAGVQIARKLANDTLKTMLEYALGSLATCLNQNSKIKRTVANSSQLSHNDFVQALAPLGDQFNDVVLYVIPSQMYFELLNTTFNNSQNLWEFGNFTVMRTALGQNFLITDNSGLRNSTTSLYGLGLKQNSAVVGMETDYIAKVAPVMQKENLGEIFQAEWTSSLRIANRRYKTGNSMNGLTYAQLTSSSNWETISSEVKDETGVIIEKLLS